MLIIHFLGIAMLLGTGFAYMFLEIPNSKRDKKDSLDFTIKLSPLSIMGYVGLTALIISGGYLILPYWPTIGNNPLLLTKLILVIMIVIITSIMKILTKKAKKENSETLMNVVGKLSRLPLMLGLFIIILAVYIFH